MKSEEGKGRLLTGFLASWWGRERRNKDEPADRDEKEEEEQKRKLGYRLQLEKVADFTLSSVLQKISIDTRRLL